MSGHSPSKVCLQHVCDRLDTPGAISRVASLFRGHPSLIQGFNKFLPIGYRIEVGSDAQSMVITVTTPSGTMLQSTNSPSIPPPPQSAPPLQELGQPSLHQPPLPLPLPSTSALGLSNALKASAGSIDVPSFDDQEHQGSEPTMDYHERQGLEPAMDYIRHIKTRFSNDPDTYKRFLGILASHKSRAENVRLCYYDFPHFDVSLAGSSFCEGTRAFQRCSRPGCCIRDFKPGDSRGPSTRSRNTRRGRVS